MTEIVPTAALASDARPLVFPPSAPPVADAARLLLPHLKQDRRINAPALRTAMNATFGGPDIR